MVLNLRSFLVDQWFNGYIFLGFELNFFFHCNCFCLELMVLKRAGIIVLNFGFSFVVFQWFCDFIFGKILDFILFSMDKFVFWRGTNVIREKVWIFPLNFGTCCGYTFQFLDSKFWLVTLFWIFCRAITENSGADSHVLSCEAVLQLCNGIWYSYRTGLGNVGYNPVGYLYDPF